MSDVFQQGELGLYGVNVHPTDLTVGFQALIISSLQAAQLQLLSLRLVLQQSRLLFHFFYFLCFGQLLVLEDFRDFYFLRMPVSASSFGHNFPGLP